MKALTVSQSSFTRRQRQIPTMRLCMLLTLPKAKASLVSQWYLPVNPGTGRVWRSHFKRNAVDDFIAPFCLLRTFMF